MSDEHATDEHATHEPKAADPEQDHHDPATHMDRHTALSDDDHGHTEMALGPIDWAKWAYALVGAAGGVVVLIVFLIAVS